MALEAADYEIHSEDMPGWLVASEGRLTIALDVTLTDDLRREGIARELINRIQNLRKESGFEVTDRIRVVIEQEPSVEEALASYGKYLCEQTLTESLSFAAATAFEGVPVEWEESTLKISVAKI